MTNQKVNARYSPEARDIYFTVPNLIRASAAIISCLEISTLMKGIEMIRSALIKLGTVK